MAARRLVIVMVILLGISTLAAAFAPRQDEEPAKTESAATGATGVEPAAGPIEASGKVVAASLEVPAERRRTIALQPGDRLRLSVNGDVGDDIEIPAFGLTETMTPDAVARFDLLVDRPGVFTVTRFSNGQVISLIRACPPAKGGAKPPARAERSPVPGCDPLAGP